MSTCSATSTNACWSWWSWINLALSSLYFFVDAILIALPSALTDPLMERYHIGASGVGLLAAIYFWIYAVLQVPVGVLLARLGPRCIQIAGLAICSIALWLASISSSFAMVCLSRALMGVGASAGYLVPLVVAGHWFPQRYHAAIIGIILMVECLGSIWGGLFLAEHQQLGLSSLLQLLALGCFLLMLICAVYLRDHPEQRRTAGLTHSSGYHFTVLGNRQLWKAGAVASLLWLPVAVFATLWGPSFLQIGYGLSLPDATRYLAVMWLGIGVGAPLVGLVLAAWKDCGRLLGILSVVGCAAAIALVYVRGSAGPGLEILLLGVGVACSGQVLAFDAIKSFQPAALVPASFGMANTMICMLNAFSQLLSSWLLDVGRIARQAESRGYNLSDYHLALCLLPVAFAVAFRLCRKFLVVADYPEISQ